MTAAAKVAPEVSVDAPALALDRRVILAFFKLSSGFWQGATAKRAWAITLGLALFLGLSIGVTLALNHWNRWFFDALAAKDAPTLGRAVLVLGLIVGSMAGIGVGIVRCRETLQVRWREWVTRTLVERWLGQDRFYHLGLTRTDPANPEYRISDDTRWATELLVDCAIGLFLAVIGATAFIGILWSVGGSLSVAVGGFNFVIPAYMVLAALLYGTLASSLMLRIGRPLVGSVVAKNEAEGHFRFALMRVRDNAESIALSRGTPGEQRIANSLYDTLVGRWLAIVRQHGNLTWITNASGPFVPIFPLIVATPKYLSGQLTIGEVIQLAAAFVQVQVAISWIVDNYNKIADWYASARRIIELTDACEAIDARMRQQVGSDRLQMTDSPDGSLRIEGVTILDPAGRTIVQNAGFTALPGQRLMVSAPSGTGKSSLVRAVAGLWPWGRGRIALPQGRTMLIVPQKPYLSAITLRQALYYPNEHLAVADDQLHQALQLSGLGALTARLDEVARWDHQLSNGELQRLGVARVLVQCPDIIILDEALGALDDISRGDLMRVLGERMPLATIISFSQRESVAEADTMHVTLPTPGPQTVQSDKPSAKADSPRAPALT